MIIQFPPHDVRLQFAAYIDNRRKLHTLRRKFNDLAVVL